MVGYMEKLRDQLIRKREKLMKRPVGVVSAFVLGSSSIGAPKCVYLHTDHDRYLFNAGEGSQRLAQELKLKLRRVRNVFITQASWEKLAGLPGVAMALRDVGAMDINIYGPSDVSYVFRDSSSFVRLQGLSVNGRTCEPGGSFEDTAIKILFAPISSPSGDRAVCYVVLPKERRAVLDPVRCEQLKVPKGPMYGILKNGGQVTVDGKVISSADVTTPAEQPVVMLVVDAPTEHFIPSLMASPILSQHTNATIVFHFTPITVMRDTSYMRWMRETLQPSAAHVLVNEAAAYGTGGVAAIQQMFLHQLVPEAFPLLEVPSVLQSEGTGDGGPQPRQHSRSGFDNVIPPAAANETWRNSFRDVQNLVAAKPLMEYRLKPPSRFNVLRCPVLDLRKESSKIQEKLAQAQFSSMQNLRNVIREARSVRNDPYPWLLFTGTGGAVPSPMRNTAGILIKISSDKSILFDCAEGTLGQFLRLLGPEETTRVLSNIKAIFISHPHADHTLGLPALLKARAEVNRFSPVNIIAPVETNHWLSSCARHGFFDESSCRKFNSVDYLHDSSHLSDLCGVSEAVLGRMDHCPDAYGIAVKDNDEKITYSGDTAPNDDLVNIGLNSDILINEATLGTVLPGLARMKRHCTTRDALNLAQRMNAKNIVLTHFSTRYARIPQLLDLENARNAIIAFDNMVVRPSLLTVLPSIIQPLSEMFSDKLRRIRKKESRQH